MWALPIIVADSILLPDYNSVLWALSLVFFGVLLWALAWGNIKNRVSSDATVLFEQDVFILIMYMCLWTCFFAYLQWCRAPLSGPHGQDLHAFQFLPPGRRGSEVVARAAIWCYQRWPTALCSTASRRSSGIRLRSACFWALIFADFGSHLGPFLGSVLGPDNRTALGTRIGRRRVETQLSVSSRCRRFLVPKVGLLSEPKTVPFFEQSLGLKRGPKPIKVLIRKAMLLAKKTSFHIDFFESFFLHLYYIMFFCHDIKKYSERFPDLIAVWNVFLYI